MAGGGTIQNPEPVSQQRATASPTRSRGRPRDPQLDTAILAAARTLLARDGYASLTLESVADMAGTTMPSLRRRYASKAELISAAICSLRTRPLPPETAQPRNDALAVLRDLNRAMLHDNAMTVVGSLLAEEHRHPELLDLFRTHVVESRRSALRNALRRGMQAGELPADFDVDAATSMLSGALYGQYLTSVGLSDDWADRILAAVWPD